MMQSQQRMMSQLKKMSRKTTNDTSSDSYSGEGEDEDESDNTSGPKVSR